MDGTTSLPLSLSIPLFLSHSLFPFSQRKKSPNPLLLRTEPPKARSEKAKGIRKGVKMIGLRPEGEKKSLSPRAWSNRSSPFPKTAIQGRSVFCCVRIPDEIKICVFFFL